MDICKVNECHRCSVEHDDPVLDREIELQERARCVRKLKNCRHWMHLTLNSYSVYCACAYECLAAPCLYLACFTPVAPVASL